MSSTTSLITIPLNIALSVKNLFKKNNHLHNVWLEGDEGEAAKISPPSSLATHKIGECGRERKF